jgi:hypothetical protein
MQMEPFWYEVDSLGELYFIHSPEGYVFLQDHVMFPYIWSLYIRKHPVDLEIPFVRNRILSLCQTLHCTWNPTDAILIARLTTLCDLFLKQLEVLPGEPFPAYLERVYRLHPYFRSVFPSKCLDTLHSYFIKDFYPGYKLCEDYLAWTKPVHAESYLGLGLPTLYDVGTLNACMKECYQQTVC